MEYLNTLFESYVNLFSLVTELFWLNLKFLSLSIIVLCGSIFVLLLVFILHSLLLKFVLMSIPRGNPNKRHVAFFHPYCNAGGGGERVLWCSIQAIQSRYPQAECYVYTGDIEATPHEIMENVFSRFNIRLQRQPQFIFLKLRFAVEAKYYPFLTLLMQSLGSVILGAEALSKFRPDVYIDTMGYAFTYPLFRFIGGCAVGCYTHYPTISSDMLGRVYDRTEAHNNRAFISQSFILSIMKLYYYRLFAFVYGLVGSCAHVIMVNSSWTKGHICDLWKYGAKVETVFPPCDTAMFSNLALIDDNEKEIKSIVSIGQFRPEKDYPLQLRSFKKLLNLIEPEASKHLRLVLIGGVRNSDDEGRVESLKLLARDLEIDNKIIWKINASFSELLQEVQKGTIGIHTMWNEHFGIGIVESMAGGLVMLAHDSGGPKMDIVTPFNGKDTGFLASAEESYSNKMKHILNLSNKERKDIRETARLSTARFSRDIFKDSFLTFMGSLLDPNRNE